MRRPIRLAQWRAIPLAPRCFPMRSEARTQEGGDRKTMRLRVERSAENSLEANYRWNFYGRFNAVRFRSTASLRSVLFTVIDRRGEGNGEKMKRERESERKRNTERRGRSARKKKLTRN